jgi:hypothetical protein
MDANLARQYLEGKVDSLAVSQPAEEVNPNSSPDSVQAQPDDTNPNPDEHRGEDQPPAAASTETQTPPSEPAKPNEPPPSSEKPPKEKLPYREPDPKHPKPNDAQAYKANKAFIKQKEKYKAKVASLEAQIAAQQAQIEKLKKMNPEALSDEQKEDLRFETRMANHDIANLNRQKDEAALELQLAEADQIHEARIAACMKDPQEVEHYHRLLENGREKFVDYLSKVDPENAIINYLDDCDVSPLMVRLLMTKPEVLKQVVTKRNPLSKTIELRSIENKMLMAMRLKSTSSKAQPNQNPPQPVTTGRVVGKSAGTPGPMSPADWRAYVAAHP